MQNSRAVLRHSRATQRLVVRQRLNAVRAGPVDEPLTTHVHCAVQQKHALFDTQYRVGEGRIVNYDDGAGRRNH